MRKEIRGRKNVGYKEYDEGFDKEEILQKKEITTVIRIRRKIKGRR